MEDKNSLWNSAAKTGLVLGGVSVLYLALTALTGKIAANGHASFLMSIVNIVLWIAKFGGCIWLMRFFMLKFGEGDPNADNSRSFRFGVVSALLSSLVYSAFYMAYLKFFAGDMIEEVFATLEENPMFTSSMMEQVEEMLPMFPIYGFFGNLIYCFLFGTVLAAILSRNIPPQNPFKER